MRLALRFLIGLSLLQGSAFAFQGPEIQVVDGKITMSAHAVPLGQLLNLFDRALGLKSEVLEPNLANRNISVRFSDLDLNGAVQKIFEGQPLNYVLRAGKGIIVTDAAEGGSASASNPISSFSQPQITNAPLQPGVPTIQPIVNSGPAGNTAAQPAAPPNANNPFGTAPVANPAANNNTPSGPGQLGGTPGQIGPNPGASNPLITPTGAPNQPAGVIFPGPQQTPPPQPSGPGAAGATPGALPSR